MVSLLDCIERIPAVLEYILNIREENFAPLFDSLGEDLHAINEIVYVGSGTSNTSAITARFFVEKVMKLRTTVYYPNDFCHNTYSYNPKALYVFTSQTGTSIVAREAQKKMAALGYHTVSVTESPQTPIARESPCHIDMGCGVEEYPTRTIGYSASVFTHMLLGLELAKRRGTIDAAGYESCLAMAKAVPDSHRTITPAAMRWMDATRRQMLRSRCIVFTGADALQGVALEGAVKVWELPQMISIGYELEEGIHGPNYGYNSNHCVIVLNDGGREDKKALALGRWMKEIYHNGLLVGSSVAAEDDLKLDVRCGDFSVLEFAPVVQIIAYRLANDMGRDLFAPHDNSVMERYFKTHREDEK